MCENQIKIKECICCWYDLLGYGKPFVDSKWNLYDDRCKINIERIKNVKGVFLGSWSAMLLGIKLAFNDGFASTIDIDMLNPKCFLDYLIYLEGIVKDFDSINAFDKGKGFPGIRGVVTCGQRFEYDGCNSSYDVVGKRTISYFPKEFQMNTAFSKAFIMEESGSRANISESHLYIDVKIYEFIKKASQEIKCKSPQILDKGDELLIKIFDETGWFADICVEKNAVEYKQSTEYNNRGIETLLYKYKSLHSRIDEYAAEAEYQKSLRYSILESEEDEQHF